MFPAPLEVDRELYSDKKYQDSELNKFPAPREVDRYIYKITSDEQFARFMSFRPLAR